MPQSHLATSTSCEFESCGQEAIYIVDIIDWRMIMFGDCHMVALCGPHMMRFLEQQPIKTENLRRLQ